MGADPARSAELVKKSLYNLENRLVEVRDDADASIGKYGYDPFGRRLWKEVGGVRTYFLYAEEGLAAEMDAGGAITRQYGWQPGGMWGTDPVYLSTGGSTYFYQNDHLGTPQKLVGVNGTVVWAAKYGAFGMAHSDVKQVENPLRFPGQYTDSETGLHYNFFRNYRPAVGSYAESDPVGLYGGMNSYQYVGANPLTGIDPLGLRRGCPPGMRPGRDNICETDPFAGSDKPCVTGDCAFFPDTTNEATFCGSGWNKPIVPDSPWGKYRFHVPCENHDRCYATCGARKGNARKEECDQQFLEEMLEACDRLTPFWRTDCRQKAKLYHAAVKGLGGGAFKNAQKKCLGCSVD